MCLRGLGCPRQSLVLVKIVFTQYFTHSSLSSSLHQIMRHYFILALVRSPTFDQWVPCVHRPMKSVDCFIWRNITIYWATVFMSTAVGFFSVTDHLLCTFESVFHRAWLWCFEPASRLFLVKILHSSLSTTASTFQDTEALADGSEQWPPRPAANLSHLEWSWHLWKGPTLPLLCEDAREAGSAHRQY